MRADLLIILLVGATATFYLLVTVSSRSGSRSDFYTRGSCSSPLGNGMASAADWLCAATFLGFFGLISVNPLESQIILSGWIAGLVLMGGVIAPAQFRSGQICLSSYLGVGYGSRVIHYLALSIVVLICTMILALQLRGMSLLFSRHLQLSVQAGVIITMLLLLFYVVLGAMKAMTQVQLLQYCILFCALMILAVYLAGSFDERFGVLLASGFFSNSGFEFQQSLAGLKKELGFSEQAVMRERVDILLLLISLIAGVAVLPHILMRFQSVKKTTDVSYSTVWMLVFLGLIYSSMPLIAEMGELRLIQSVNGELNEGRAYSRMPDWFYSWEQSEQLAWYDHNQDGKVQYAAGQPFDGLASEFTDNKTGLTGERIILNPVSGVYDPHQQRFPPELYVAEEVRLYLVPEVSAMPVWVVGMLSVGIVAAVLSSASVLIISTVHSVTAQLFPGRLTQRGELKLARFVAVLMLLMAGVFALLLSDALTVLLNRVIALAASTLFPATLLLILRPKVHPYAVLLGMLSGLSSYLMYTLWFSFNLHPAGQEASLFALSPEAFGACAMLLNFAVTLLLAGFFKGAVLCIKE